MAEFCVMKHLPKKKIIHPDGYTLIMRIADGKLFLTNQKLLTSAPKSFTKILPMNITSEDESQIVLEFSSEEPLLYKLPLKLPNN